MGRKQPHTGPTCASCAYSLAGLNLHELPCPECGQIYVPPPPPAPPLPPLTFRDRIARAHVVCSINSLLCILIGLFAPASDSFGPGDCLDWWDKSVAGSEWEWKGGATVAAVLNFILFIVLIVKFHQRSSPTALIVTAVLCCLSFGMIALGSIR